jgi:hypothetical protein
MLNAKRWQVTATERKAFVERAQVTANQANVPITIFIDTSGAVRSERQSMNQRLDDPCVIEHVYPESNL